MSKNLRKKNLFSILVVILILLPGFSFAFFWIFKDFNQKDVVVKKIDVLYSVNTKWKWKLNQYPFNKSNSYLTMATPKPFLSKVGLKKLAQKLYKELFYGHEITQLNAINIGDFDLAKKSVGGFYIPETKEIFINIANWIYKNTLSEERKINWIFSTIVHEYGHHIANMHLSNIPISHEMNYNHHSIKSGVLSLNIQKARSNEAGNDDTYWNKYFTKKFYNLLYKGSESPSNRFKVWPDKIYQFRDFTLFDIFWNANSPNYRKSGKGWFGKLDPNWKIEFGSIQIKPHYPNIRQYYNKVFLNYRYSMEEIVVRKLVNLMHIYNQPQNPKDWVFEFKIKDRKVQIVDNFVSDLLPNYRIIDVSKNKDGPLMVKPSQKIFQDYVFGGEKLRPKQLFEIYRRAMGFGKLISNIYLENRNKAEYHKEDEGGKLKLKANQALFNHNLIDITGWIPKGFSELKVIKYLKNDILKETEYLIDTESNLYLWKFKHKQSIFQTKSSDLIGKLPIKLTPYIVRDIDLSDAIKAEIKYGIDINGNNQIDHDEWRGIAYFNTIKDDFINKTFLNPNSLVSSYRKSHKTKSWIVNLKNDNTDSTNNKALLEKINYN